MKATIYRNFKNDGVKSLIVIAKDIAEGKYQSEIEYIRTLYAEGKHDEVDKCKAQLLAFTPSGTYKEQRIAEYLDEYSGFVHLDFDELAPEQLDVAFKIIAEIPYTFLCFRSPRGNGLKVFVEVTTGAEHHDIAYKQVQEYYEERVGLKSDPKCKDITRLCFMSYDPQLHKNISGNQKFIVDISKQDSIIVQSVPVTIPDEPRDISLWKEILDDCLQFTERKKTYERHNRNEFIYLFASNANRKGVPEEMVYQYCQDKNYDLPLKEMQRSISSAYTHHKHEFAKFANVAKPQSQQEDGDEQFEDSLKATPTIPDSIYNALPDILREGSMAFTDKRKRDVFLTGALAIISGCLPNVTGIYFQERIYPHIFVFIIAPPASGKGVLKNAKRLADKFHDKVHQQSREAKDVYENELAAYKTALRNLKKGEQPPEKPAEPPFKIVFIPADCSQARMVEHLQLNDGNGIICESEADTMTGAKKQEWGDYSPILRLAFHHERIAFSRKTNNTYVEIKEPRVAMALTGTPAQAPRLLSSAEDGLFSRILFYAYKNEAEWQDPSPQSGAIVYNDHFDSLSQTLLNYIEQLEASPTEIKLQQHQWDQLNSAFKTLLAEVTIFTSEQASGIVYRLGLILFRLCMIFTALRKCENAEASEVMHCSDDDFLTALELSKIYLKHSLLMFNNLPNQSEHTHFQSGNNKRQFFDALPAQFTRKQAVELGIQYKLSARSVDEILSMSADKTLKKIKPGYYEKM